MKVTNPYFKQASADEAKTLDSIEVTACTKTGICLKTLFCIVAAIIAGLVVAITFNRAIYDGALSDTQKADMLSRMLTFLIIAVIVAFFASFVGRIAPKSAVVCAPLYSVGEGAAIGLLCAMAELEVAGVTIVAGLGTALIFGLSLLAYSLGLKNKMGTVFTFLVVFLLAAVLSSLGLVLFTVFNPTVQVSLGLLLAIELLYLAYASFCLLTNFKEVDVLVERGSDKKYEWSVALGLVISILYLFVELIRIILIIASMFQKD